MVRLFGTPCMYSHYHYHCSYCYHYYYYNQVCGVLILLDSYSGLENVGLRTLALKNLDSNSDYGYPDATSPTTTTVIIIIT